MDLEDPDSIYNSPVLEDDIANLGRGTGEIPALKPIRDWPDDNKLDDDELIILRDIRSPAYLLICPLCTTAVDPASIILEAVPIRQQGPTKATGKRPATGASAAPTKKQKKGSLGPSARSRRKPVGNRPLPTSSG